MPDAAFPDKFRGYSDSMTSPITAGTEVVLDADLPFLSRALWVNASGDLRLLLENSDTPVTLSGAQAGTLLPIRVRQVQTGTTASVVALW